ncbi:MAG: phosphate acyltransferase PlsX [Acidimicrobiales bacterium]
MLPIALDAMGGDSAPDDIVAGARLAADSGLDIVLVGPPELIGGLGFEVIAASEVIAMDADAGSSVRKMKDSSLVRAAEAVRDGRASAMVSAGNTGATMASALLRMGRIRGVARPAIATPLPVPGRETPNVLIDAGANAECQPEWLALFARMGAVYVRDRYGTIEPRVGLLSIGEEAGKGTPLVKEAFELLSDDAWQSVVGCRFVGNVEGRDLLADEADVIVTDGFTGNVALKTAEGVARTVTKALLEAFDSSDDARRGAELLMPALLPLYETFDPESTGGAVLLGVRGVCVISHGSSGPKAVANALTVAADLVRGDVVGHLTDAVAG